MTKSQHGGPARTPIDTAELERLAAAIPAGPWIATFDHPWMRTDPMTDPRKIKRLIDWLVKQRAQHLDMVTDAGDSSLWCKEEADLISEHIRTVEALATRPKAGEVTPRPAWDDETCLRFAEAYDREDAAQRGEPSPHADKGEGYAEWVADRIACARAGLAALTPAPQPEGQECSRCGSVGGFGCYECTPSAATPPQPSEAVAACETVLICAQEMCKAGHPVSAFNVATAALRALKGGNDYG